MKKGLLIILSGPSGVGKGTVRSYLMKNDDLDLRYSISMTTRKPRIGELNGRDYFFVTTPFFLQEIREKKLLEYARFVNHYYGTPKEYVDKLLNEGHNVLLEIETNGAQQVMSIYKDYGYISIFLTCCDLAELERRIRGRRTETDKVVHERVEKARKELLLSNKYQYVVINDKPDRAAKEISDIIISHSNAQ